MREADKVEVMASCGRSPVDALYESVYGSTRCWTGMVDDKPAFIFGVAPLSLMGGVGSPWLLGTDKVLEVKREFLENSKPYVAEMWLLFPTLKNFVDVRNKVSIRWLKWIGFSMLEPIPYGINGELFHPFELSY
jgi:hypothetical protein